MPVTYFSRMLAQVLHCRHTVGNIVVVGYTSEVDHAAIVQGNIVVPPWLAISATISCCGRHEVRFCRFKQMLPGLDASCAWNLRDH